MTDCSKQQDYASKQNYHFLLKGKTFSIYIFATF